jgi:hypothetical protein
LEPIGVILMSSPCIWCRRDAKWSDSPHRFPKNLSPHSIQQPPLFSA